VTGLARGREDPGAWVAPESDGHGPTAAPPAGTPVNARPPAAAPVTGGTPEKGDPPSSAPVSCGPPSPGPGRARPACSRLGPAEPVRAGTQR
jgi:hypothetical protein